MAISLQYKGLNEINGSLVVLDNIPDASFDELVELKLDNGATRLGRVVEIEGERVVVQIFEGTNELSLNNTTARFTGKPMELPLSKELLGRIFNGAGKPIDGLGDIYPDSFADINGKPINPVSRVYPRNYIRTGISSIDALMTLIRGQKLPIFSDSGLATTSWPPSWYGRQKLPMRPGRDLELYLRQWGSPMTWRITLRRALRKAEYWNGS